jgi:hypothetical protein
LRRFLRPTHKGFFPPLEELACFLRRFLRPTHKGFFPSLEELRAIAYVFFLLCAYPLLSIVNSFLSFSHYIF